jgi:hypothetical protein
LADRALQDGMSLEVHYGNTIRSQGNHAASRRKNVG